MILKKVLWLFKRHPFLYLARFKLLSKNSTVEDIKRYTYNQFNTSEAIPSNFKTVNDIVFENNKPNKDIETVKQLSQWLQNNIIGGPGLSESSDRALQIMLAGKGGVCSDMAQIFNNFCVINSILVREWGTTRAPFNKKFGGHSFNEVYSETFKKWILIDVSSSVLFYYDSDMPLSVIELFQLVRANQPVHFKTFNEKKPLLEKNIVRNYLNPDTIPFLICNYSNKTYDTFLKYTRPLIPVFITHFFLFVVGKSYHYRFPLDDYKKILY